MFYKQGSMDKIKDVGEISSSTLHEVASEGLSKECQELLRRGEDVNSRDSMGWTPLMLAARNGHYELVEKLLDLSADASLSNSHGVTVFTLSVIHCHKDVYEKLYGKLGEDQKQAESNNALQVACVRGLYKVAKWLLRRTVAQVDHSSSKTDLTPLHLAVIGHHYKVVELLLAHGADPTVITPLGHDGFELAKAVRDKKILNLLHQSTSPLQDTGFDFPIQQKALWEPIEPFYTQNKILLNIKGDVVLKNSPNRPVFKTDQNNYLNQSVNNEMSLLGSPSIRSVFLPRRNGNSPARLIFKNKEDTSFYSENNQTIPLDDCSSFQPSPQLCSTPTFHHLRNDYTLNSFSTPKNKLLKSPLSTSKKAKKRKLTYTPGCTSWLKLFSKRRSQSSDDSGGYVDLDSLRDDVMDFSQLLFGLGLEQFYPAFRHQELDVWTFLTLTKEDLVVMGIQEEKDQAKILKGVKELRKVHF